MTEYDINNYQKKIISSNESSSVDVPVLLMFFNRPQQTKEVFESIKKARPSILFLYQDGPRHLNDNDQELILECRRIVEEIDWKCTVYTLFQETNYGCDPSGFISRKWVFSIVQKCIILEDDCVPSVSFFPFCKELLDKYENDKRIYRICGQNILGDYSPYYGDYFFTKGGSIWGWATWKRVIDEWDEEYKFLGDERIVETIRNTYKKSGIPAKRFLKTCNIHKQTNKEYFESIFLSSRILGSGLTIVPSKNMISNIGITNDSVHGKSNIHMYPKRIQRVFNAKRFELSFPIAEPEYVLEDKKYEMTQSKIMGWNICFIKKIVIIVDELLRKLLFGRGSKK